ncbi:hypothetical protein QBC35DRAFT_456985 [Podospora australis]|uniref:Uncharacterized protein n=1 Tax=Podospora australis TaxID=1536484 RepID=A0AAN6WLY3_9PEZI|nr:hypothetical protein QBC35DRAFT_456985 [Podospora australis]
MESWRKVWDLQFDDNQRSSGSLYIDWDSSNFTDAHLKFFTGPMVRTEFFMPVLPWSPEISHGPFNHWTHYVDALISAREHRDMHYMFGITSLPRTIGTGVEGSEMQLIASLRSKLLELAPHQSDAFQPKLTYPENSSRTITEDGPYVFVGWDVSPIEPVGLVDDLLHYFHATSSLSAMLSEDSIELVVWHDEKAMMVREQLLAPLTYYNFSRATMLVITVLISAATSVLPLSTVLRSTFAFGGASSVAVMKYRPVPLHW